MCIVYYELGNKWYLVYSRYTTDKAWVGIHNAITRDVYSRDM